ncbi:hypothetical protein [Pseudonocardia sp. C8]|nr:hypothetical protein [Pseudonocardia sp. C8]
MMMHQRPPSPPALIDRLGWGIEAGLVALVILVLLGLGWLPG